jgi:hypothetical protein
LGQAYDALAARPINVCFATKIGAVSLRIVATVAGATAIQLGAIHLGTKNGPAFLPERVTDR